jgi:hypothetical protein
MSAKHQMVCKTCGSADVVCDAWASWDVEKQDWVLNNTFDDTFCNKCEESCKIEKRPATPEELNGVENEA